MKKLLKIFAIALCLCALGALIVSCGEEPADTTTAMHVHEYTPVNAVPATCTENGTRFHFVCSCGLKFNEQHIEISDVSSPKLNHPSKSLVPAEAATCQREGVVEHYYCTACEGRLDPVSLAPLATHIAPKAAHRKGTPVPGEAATCVREGSADYYPCLDCYSPLDANGQLLTTTVLPYAPHTYGEWIEEQPATCTQTGVLGHYHCSTCESDYDAQDNSIINLTIPVTHTYGELIPGVSPTCSAMGSVDHYTCSLCGKHFNDQKNPISKIILPKAAHDFVSGACSVCERPAATEGLVFYEYSDEVSLTGLGTAAGEAHIVIPEFYNDKPVTRIGDDVFNNNTAITSLTLPEQLKSIGSGNNFTTCTNLSAVYIWDIAHWCENYEHFYDGSSPFLQATTLYIDNREVTDLVIPEGVTEIHRAAFRFFPIVSVTIPDSVKYINYQAFKECAHLEKVYFGSGLIWVNDEAFYGCDDLMEVHIKSITDLISVEFYSSSCNPLYHAERLFIQNQLVTDLVIPEGVSEIAKYSLAGLQVNSLTLPSTIESINSSFGTVVNTVNIPDLDTWLNIDFYYEACNPLSYGAGLYIDGALVTEVLGISGLKRAAFYKYTRLAKITFTADSVSLGQFALAYCTGLHEVAITADEIYLESGAMRDCNAITSFTISGTVTHLADSALESCTALASITVAADVTGYDFRDPTVVGIGTYALSGCTDLTEIVYLGTVSEWEALDLGGQWLGRDPYPISHITCSDGQSTRLN